MEFLRRLTRKWWVMLLLGVVVGLGAGGWPGSGDLGFAG